MTHQNRIATTSSDGRRRWRRLGPVFTVLASLIVSAEASAAGEPVFARHGMVATADALATKVGVAILKAGGNAVDSAVAVGFAMAVTLPRAGNLGGGGFMMIRRPGDPAAVAIDYRETAPAAAHPDMFLDATGAVDQKRVRFSHL
ncbi:MAG: gamma-glutamyltransferase, partial [Pseudomonadota bacterium]|nr:gamma-glutamyltransferase [Pseudomonadota bacterium]